MKVFGNVYDSCPDAGDGQVDCRSEGRHLAADGRVVPARTQGHGGSAFPASNGATVVTHDELLEGVWRDTHVAPGALARSISILRRELDDDAKRPTYIHTIPEARIPIDVPAAPASVAAHSARRWRVHWWALAGALALLGLIAPVNRRAAAPEPKRSIFTGRFGRSQSHRERERVRILCARWPPTPRRRTRMPAWRSPTLARRLST